MAQTWKQNSAVQRLLDSKFASGELNNDSKPLPTWESNSEFQKYKLNTFRTKLNMTKQRLGLNLTGAIVPVKRSQSTDDLENMHYDLDLHEGHRVLNKNSVKRILLLKGGIQKIVIGIFCVSAMDSPIIWH